MPKVGDKVRIVGNDLYLGKWLPVGTECEVVRFSEEGYVHVLVGGKQYTLAPAEFEVIRRAEQTVVIDDDGYID